jgi:2-polyprenyl-3-methyl-5-hydroxy-6-metoxy-1,4-benzoquinol methylase
MDDAGVDTDDLAENFGEIEQANRHFGGVRPVVREVLAREARSVLDVGCGSGDVARGLMREARKRGRPLEITASDYSDAVLEIARARTGGAPIRFERADARALPYGDGAFDVATCNLALHHFEPPDAVVVLRELRRVSRLTPLVSDLVRSRTGYVAALAFAHLIARNRLTKHDAPLSVRRAYTPAEVARLARQAGWARPVVRRAPFFRMLVTDGG